MKVLKFSGLILLAASIFLIRCRKDDPSPMENQDTPRETPLDAISRFLSLDTSNQAIKIDGFLKVPDIPGDGRKDGHEDDIEIQAIKWIAGIQIIGETGNGTVVGRKLQSFTFTKKIDKASPKLKEAFASHKIFPEVIFYISKAGGSQQNQMMVKLERVMISSYSTSGLQGELVNETLSFNWSKVDL